jgi:tetratricopeptide (TPR) repeat protein
MLGKYPAITVCLLMTLSFIALSAQNADVLERYRRILHDNPRDEEGGSFERMYRLYLDGPGVDQLVREYETAAKENPNDANIHLILGHIYKRLGKEGKAIEEYRRAVKLSPENYYLRFVLGRAYLSLRQYDDAIAELERAASLKPKERTPIYADDLLDIYRSLGKAYLRKNRPDDAVKAWRKIAELESEDVYLRQELADLFVEQGLYPEAIEQYRAIIRMKKSDPYKVCQSLREIGRIYELMGEYEKAMDAYEQILTKTAPGHWLRREIQSRITAIYMRRNNLSGLIEYYRGKIRENPTDPELLGLLAEAYVENGRMKEAVETYREGLNRFPQDIGLRLGLIRVLEKAKRYQEAASEYGILIERDPNRIEIYRDLGALYLRMKRPEKAKATWERFVRRRPDDATTHAMVAEIYSQFDFPDEAAAHYEKAIELDPGNLDYLEVLGELYLKSGDRERAISTWRGMVGSESLATSANYARLSEVLLRRKNRYGEPVFLEEALDAMKKAVELAPEDFHLRKRYAEMLLEAGRYEAALKGFDEAAKLAPSELLRMKMEDEVLEIYERQGVLEERIRELESKRDDDYRRYVKLARMYVRMNDLDRTMRNLQKALELAPDKAYLLGWQAELYRRMGRLMEAIQVNNRLIKLDKANAREYYITIARLKDQLNRREEARAAMNQAIALNPRDSEGYRLLAEMESRWGNDEAAVELLKKAMKLEGDSPELHGLLANIYRKGSKLHMAAEQYWTCLKLSGDMMTKLSYVKPLIEIYSGMDKLDELQERFTLMARSRGAGVVPILALAKIDEFLGDLSGAREKVAQALSKRPMQPEILRELVRLSVEGGDIKDAVEYQRLLAEAEPSDQNLIKLGELMLEAGYERKAINTWNQMLEGREDDPKTYLELTALMVKNDLIDEAIATLKHIDPRRTDDPELLYRIGVTYLELSRPELSKPYFRKLLYLPNGEPLGRRMGSTLTYDVLLKELELARDLESKIKGAQPWRPRNLAEMQAAALVWLEEIAQQRGDPDTFLRELLADAERSRKDPKPRLWLVGLYLLRGEDERALDLLASVARSPDSRDDPLIRGALLSLAKRLKSDQPESLDGYIQIALDGPIDDPEILKGIYDELIAMRRIEQAEKLLESSFKEQSPELRNWYPVAYLQLARAYSGQDTDLLIAEAMGMRIDEPEAFKEFFEDLVQLGRIGEAEEILERSKSEGEPTGLESWYPSAYLLLAQEHLKLKHKEDAERFISEALSLEIADPKTVRSCFEVLIQLDKREEAESLLDRYSAADLMSLEELKSWYPQAYLQLADSERAYARLRSKAEYLALEDEGAFQSLYETLVTRGKLKDAERLLDKAASRRMPAKLLSWYPNAYLRLAQIYRNNNRPDEADRLVEKSLSSEITDPNEFQRFFNLFLSFDRYEEAAEILKKATSQIGAKRFPSYWLRGAYRRLGTGYVRRGQFEKAAELYMSYLESSKPVVRQYTGFAVSSGLYSSYRIQYPNETRYYDYERLNILRELFNLYFTGGKEAELFSTFEKRLAQAKGGDRIFLALALSYFHWWADDVEGSIRWLEESCQIAPNDNSLKLIHAVLLTQTGEFERGINLLFSYVQESGRNAKEIYKLIQQIGRDSERPEVVKRAAERLLKLRLSAQEYLDLARTCKGMGLYSMYMDALSKAIERSRGARDGYLIQSLIAEATGIPSLAERLRSVREILDSRERRLVEAARKLPDSHRIQINLARFYESTGRGNVRAAFERALAARPNDDQTLIKLADMLRRRGDRAVAAEYYKRALQNDPNLWRTISLWSVMYSFLNSGRIREFVELVDESYSKIPGYLLTRMAEEGLKQRYPEEAGKLYEIYLRRYSTYSYYLTAADLYLKANRADKAVQAIRKYLEAVRVRNASFESRVIDLAERAGILPELTRKFEEELQGRLDDLSLMKAFARIYARQGDDGKAIEMYESALKRKPDDVEAIKSLAQLYAKRDEAKKAVALFETSLSRKEVNPELIAEYALMLISHGDIGKAIELTDRLLKSTANVDYQHLWNLADGFMRAGVYDVAARVYENLIARGYDGYLEHLGNAYEAAGDREKARAAWRRFAVTRLRYGSWYNRCDAADVLARHGMLDEAEEMYKSVVRSAMFRYPREQALRKLFEMARKRNGLNELVEELAAEPIAGKGFLYKLMVEEYRKEDRLVRAKEVLEEVLRMNPKDLRAREQLADVCLKLKDFEGCAAQWEELTKLEPMNPAYWENLVRTYLDLEKFDLAVDAAERYVKAFPSSMSYRLLGETYKARESYDEATKAFLKSVELNPNDGEIYAQLAEIWQVYGDATRKDQVLRRLDEIISKNPSAAAYRNLGDLYKKPAVGPIFGKALSLDGGGDYAEIPTHAPIHESSGTIAAWIFPKIVEEEKKHHIVYAGQSGGDGYGGEDELYLMLDGARLEFVLFQNRSYVFRVRGDPTLESDNWYYVAATWDGRSAKLYLNGSLVGSQNYSVQISKLRWLPRIRIGFCNNPTANRGFNGAIDDVRIWSIALTQEQIRAMMYAPLTGDEPGLVGYWRFDKDVRDSSPYRHDGTLGGDAELVRCDRPIVTETSFEQLTQATEAYRKAIELDPTSYEGYKLLAQTYIQMENPWEAEKVYRQALDWIFDGGNRREIYRALVRIYSDQDKLSRLEDEIDDGRGIKPSADLYEEIAKAYDSEGQPTEAARAYEKAARLDEGDFSRYEQLAKVYIAAQKYKEAIEAYHRSLWWVSEAKRREEIQKALVALYRKHDSLENLLAKLNEGKTEPEVGLYDKIAQEYVSRRDYRKAAEVYRKALSLTDEGKTRERILGALWNLFDENGAYEEAVATFTDITVAYPNEPLAYELLGDAYRRLGDITAADAAYGRWFELQKLALETSGNKDEDGLRKLQLMRYLKEVSPQRDWHKTGVVWVDLGDPDDENGLRNSFNSDFDDGAVKPVTKAGEKARQVGFDRGGWFIYFDVDDDFIFAEMSDVWIAVEYFDEGENRAFHLQYDSYGDRSSVATRYKSAETIRTKGTGRWKFYIYHITDAFFGNGQNGGSDFRLDMHVGSKEESGKEIALNRIFVFSTYGLGRALGWSTERLIAEYKRMAEISDSDGWDEAWLHWKLGNLYEREGDEERAREEYEGWFASVKERLKNGKPEAIGLGNVARKCAQKGIHSDEAAVYAMHALLSDLQTISGDETTIEGELETLWRISESLGGFDRVLREYETTVTVEPADQAAYAYVKAEMYGREGNSAKALENARKAVQLFPNRTRYIDALVRAYLMNGRRDEAVKAMREYPAIRRSAAAWNRFFEKIESLLGGSQQTEMKAFLDELSKGVYDDQFHIALAELYRRLKDQGKASLHLKMAGFIPEESWWHVGPFENARLDTPLPPEIQVDLKASYPTARGTLRWERWTDGSPDGKVDLRSIHENAENAVAYAWTTITSPGEREIEMIAEFNDGLKIWLNGEEILNAETKGTDTRRVRTKLRRGANELLVKSHNLILDWWYKLKILSPQRFIDERSWWLIAPFDNTGGRGFDAVFPPESEINLKATYPGKSGDIRWERRHDGDPDDGIVNLGRIYDNAEWAVAYGWTIINSPVEKTVLLGIGSDDDVKVWLNGELVHSHKVARGVDVNQDIVGVRLRKGENELLIKVCNQGGQWGFVVTLPGEPLFQAGF